MQTSPFVSTRNAGLIVRTNVIWFKIYEGIFFSISLSLFPVFQILNLEDFSDNSYLQLFLNCSAPLLSNRAVLGWRVAYSVIAEFLLEITISSLAYTVQ